MPSTVVADSLRLLLERAVDYAGLFPPAALGMREAVSNYAAYRSGPHAWLLGRFIVPAARLEEFSDVAAEFLPRESEGRGWQLSALIGDDYRSDANRALTFNDRHQGSAEVDVCELRVETAEQLVAVARCFPRTLRCYFEIPLRLDAGPFALAAVSARAGLKARTGGVTSEAFPAASDLVRFIRASLEHGVPFKMTAGLHHPLAGEYRLTYDEDAACAPMLGFLTVFLATALIRAGASNEAAIELLNDRDTGTVQFDATGAVWRDFTISSEHIAAARHQLAGFGSCSFTEPVDELSALGLVQ